MADTTAGQLELIACPPEHVSAVLDVINQYGLRRDYLARGDEEVLVLCEEYADEVMLCGDADNIASALAELDGVAFLVSEDPKYEWLGDLHYRLPDGRSFSASSDADRQVVLTEGAYQSLEGLPDDALRRALEEHFGSGLVAEWRGLRDELVKTPEPERTVRRAAVSEATAAGNGHH